MPRLGGESHRRKSWLADLDALPHAYDWLKAPQLQQWP
jgi:hypothetical protein